MNRFLMRAVEWFPSFPYHVIIWDAFGWEKPLCAHLPVMLTNAFFKAVKLFRQ